MTAQSRTVFAGRSTDTVVTRIPSGWAVHHTYVRASYDGGCAMFGFVVPDPNHECNPEDFRSLGEKLTED